MPRLAVKDWERIICIKKGILEQYIMLRKMDNKKLASEIGVTEETFRNKRKNPEKFKCIELAKLNIILQIPREKYL